MEADPPGTVVEGVGGARNCMNTANKVTSLATLGASVPSPLMVWWAAGFTALLLLYAIRAFRRRSL